MSYLLIIAFFFTYLLIEISGEVKYTSISKLLTRMRYEQDKGTKEK